MPDALSRPTLLAAVTLAAAGKGVVSCESARLVWRAWTDDGPVTEGWQYRTPKQARLALAHARAVAHLSA